MQCICNEPHRHPAVMKISSKEWETGKRWGKTAGEGEMMKIRKDNRIPWKDLYRNQRGWRRAKQCNRVFIFSLRIRVFKLITRPLCLLCYPVDDDDSLHDYHETGASMRLKGFSEKTWREEERNQKKRVWRGRRRGAEERGEEKEADEIQVQEPEEESKKRQEQEEELKRDKKKMRQSMESRRGSSRSPLCSSSLILTSSLSPFHPSCIWFLNFFGQKQRIASYAITLNWQ